MYTKTIFTDREKDILHCIYAGLSNKEIAKRLFISVHTVKAHIEKLFLKTDVHNRVQLIVYAFKNGIIKWF